MHISEQLHSIFHHLLHKCRLWMTLGKKTYENIEGKEENAGNQHFLHFPQYFLHYQRKIVPFRLQLNCGLQMFSDLVKAKFWHTVGLSNIHVSFNTITCISTQYKTVQKIHVFIWFGFPMEIIRNGAETRAWLLHTSNKPFFPLWNKMNWGIPWTSDSVATNESDGISTKKLWVVIEVLSGRMPYFPIVCPNSLQVTSNQP